MTKIAMSLVLGLSLFGCKKKPAEEKPTEGSSGSAMMNNGSGSGSGASMTNGSGSAAMGSGSAAGSGSDTAMKPKTGADLADGYKACTALLNAGKFDDFKTTCIDDAYVGHEMGMTTKPADVVAFFTAMKKGFPDFKVEPQVILVNGKNVFGAVLMSGTNSGPLMMPGMPAEMPATNKKIGFMMFHRLAFNDAGKAVEEWAFEDPGTMMAQLGVAPKEAPPHRPAMEKGMDGAPMVVIATDDAKEKANLDVVKKSNDAFSAHKIADLAALMTDDTVESDQVSDKDAVGKKAVEAGAKAFMDSFSDAKITADMWAAGDYVVAIGTFDGTNDHDMGKMKKTGKHVTVPFAEVSQIKDGKVSKLWRFYSSWDFATQLGLMPPMGAPPAGAGSGSGSAAPAAGSGSGSGSAK